MSALENAYRQYLGREPDAEGLAYWQSEIASGNLTEEQAINLISTSPEAQTYFTSGQAQQNAQNITGSGIDTQDDIGPENPFQPVTSTPVTTTQPPVTTPPPATGTSAVPDLTTPTTTTGTNTTVNTATITGSGVPSDTGTAERGAAVSAAVAGNLTNPQIPQAGIQTFTPLTGQANEFSDPTDPRFQIQQQQQVSAQGATAATVATPDGIDTSTYEAALAQSAAQAEASLGNLPPEALVRFQMDELLQGIENGEIPVWAQPAVDAVEGQLASRGLSRSSVGQAALSNAIINAAFPIAQAQAGAIAQNFMQDKAAETQVSLSNAALRQQTILSDQAATNAAAQFNAASENQTNQFMTNLRTQVQLSNAANQTAVSQFNAQQANAMTQFNAQQQFARDQFNAQNATVIEQSNLQWRRQINQINTAGINSVNQANAMNAFNLSNQALTFMWQELRDSAKWTFEAAQNEKQRQAALAQAALGNEAATDASSLASYVELGKAAINLFNDNSQSS